MKIIAAIVAISLSGCSFAVRGELLNPLNKSGRVEKSEPVQSEPAATTVPKTCISSDGFSVVPCASLEKK